MIKPTFAQSIPTPSVPQFTVRYVDYSYDVPPKYGIDQYTGQNVTIQAGYHVDNRSIEFTIKNQQFTPYNDSNGNLIKLYYDFRWKGNYGDVWTYFPLDSNGRSVFHYGTFYNPVYPTAYVASNSDYSVLELGLSLLGSGYGQTLPNGVEVNFEVQALIGYFNFDPNGYLNFNGKLSDWSNTADRNHRRNNFDITPANIHSYVNAIPNSHHSRIILVGSHTLDTCYTLCCSGT